MKKLIIAAVVLTAFAACNGNSGGNYDRDRTRTDSFINSDPADTSAPGSTDTTDNRVHDSDQIRQ